MTALLFFLFGCVILSSVEAHIETEQPEIEQGWIYTMITTAWIGFILHLLIIFISIWQTNVKKISKKKKQPKFQMILNFAIWICNLIACMQWATLRSSLFFHLAIQKCTIIYMSNYLFYMMGKLALHILLLFRLYFVFRETTKKFNGKLAFFIAFVITVNFMVFTALWIDVVIDHVSVGITIPDRLLEICTLFNSSKLESVSPLEKLWPVLLGGQDLIVGIGTLSLFIYKMTEMIRMRRDTAGSHFRARKEKILKLVRKLFILGSISILSTFIFYTFAIPFYGNLTFLLPVDCCINSLCTMLLLSSSGGAYNILCFGCERCLSLVMEPNHSNEAKVIAKMMVNELVSSDNGDVRPKSDEETMTVDVGEKKGNQPILSVNSKSPSKSDLGRCRSASL